MKQCLYALLCGALLPGCAGDGMAGRALAAAGIAKAPEIAEAQKPPRSLALRLHAAARLNVDSRGRPLALVARVYHLRQHAAFDAAPYDAFLTPGADLAAFGADVVATKDVTLVPGQRYEVVERVGREAGFVGIVALYHSPAAGRWRLAFNALEAEKAGVTVGLQACALGVGTGAEPITPNVKGLGSARCQ